MDEMSRPESRLLVLIDRDGVINRNRDDYVKCREEFEFIPGSLSALRMLAEWGARVAVVTNQSAVGRGIITPEELEWIHAHMVSEVEAAGGRIDAVFCCPHAPSDGCDCRKPRPSLLLNAVKELGSDCDRCYAIGDSHNDMLAARAAGLPFVMVLTGKGHQCLAHSDIAPSWVAADLNAAVRWVLRDVDLAEREAAA